MTVFYRSSNLRFVLRTNKDSPASQSSESILYRCYSDQELEAAVVRHDHRRPPISDRRHSRGNHLHGDASYPFNQVSTGSMSLLSKETKFVNGFQTILFTAINWFIILAFQIREITAECRKKLFFSRSCINTHDQ